MNRVVTAACAVAVLMLAALCVSCGGTNPESQIKDIVERIRAGDRSQDHILQRFGVEGVPALIKYADDENDTVRYVIVEALREIGDERAIPVYLDRLDDPEEGIRGRAIYALSVCPQETLGKYRSDSMLEQLAKYARRWDPESEKAVKLIGDLNGTSQAEALRDILREAKEIQKLTDDPEAIVPKTGHETMRMLEAQGVTELGKRLFRSMKMACLRTLFKLGDEDATTEIVTALKDEDIPTRMFGMDAVKYSGRKEFAEDLFPLLNDKRKVHHVSTSSGDSYYLTVRDDAIKAITHVSGISLPFEVGRSGKFTDEHVTQVKQLLGISSDFDSKYPVIDDGTAVEQIEQIVEQIRGGAYVLQGGSLSDFTDEESLPLLLQRAYDEDARVRQSTIISLWEKRDDELVLSVLLKSLEDNDLNVRREAMEVLFSCSREALRAQVSDGMLDSLTRYVAKWRENSHKAVLLIGELGGPSHRRTLREVLREAEELQALMGDPRAVVPEMDPGRRKALFKQGGGWDDRMVAVPRVKPACLKALFKLGDKEAEKTVLTALREDNELGRAFAAEAIAYAERKELIKRLLPLLDDDRDAVAHEYAMYVDPGGARYRHVKDVAVDAVAGISKASFSFQVKNRFRYKDSEVAEVKRFLEAYGAGDN